MERVSSGRPRTGRELMDQTLLGEAVESAPFAVFVFDEDRHYVAVNQAACELTGYAREELLALDVYALADARPAEGLFRDLTVGTDASGDGVIRRKDGTTVAVSYRVSATTVAGASFFISICTTP